MPSLENVVKRSGVNIFYAKSIKSHYARKIFETEIKMFQNCEDPDKGYPKLK